MTEHSLITNITANNFELDVLLASRDIPVLVDFWADWCQPCKMLAPALEQLASEFEGAIRITKLNSDEEPELASRFGIRSLPTVKLFRDGQVVNEFSGVIPLAGIRAFIEPYLLKASDNLLKTAETALKENDLQKALTLLKEARETDPDNFRIHPLLVESLLRTGDYQEAEHILKSLPINIQQDNEILKLTARLEFAKQAEQIPKSPETLEATLQTDPDNLDARYQFSMLNVINGNYETAMENLLEIIRRDRSYKDDGGRKALINVFELLDNQGPLVRKYRGLLSSALN